MLAPDNGEFEPIARERVSEAIERALSNGTLLVAAAPGGFGKTVAIERFLESRRIPYVRFPAAAEMGSVTGFVRCLLGLLEPDRRLFPATDGDDTSLVAAVVAAQRRADRAIFIDDVEASGVDARAIALIERCARSSARPWFVATRDLAAVPFARWCASGLVDEPVDERDLRFDAADAFRLVASAGFGDAADDVAALLLRGTDGWPAAFLAALAEAATAFDRPSLAAATRRIAFDYLERFVARAWSADERRSLLRTSLFEDLPDSVLDVLGPDVRSALARTSGVSTFVGRLAAGGFCHHPLLLDFLRDRLAAAGPAAFDAAAEETARALALVGRPADGLRLALRAGPAIVLAELRAGGRILIDAGRGALVRDAVAGLPEDLRRQDVDALMLSAETGVADDAIEACVRAALEDPACEARHAELALALGAKLARTGRGPEALRLLASVDAENVASRPVRARLLATWAVMAARERSTPAVLGRALEARALADALEDGASRAAVYGALAEVFARARTFDDALALASSAIDSSLRSGAIRLELRARVTLYRVSLELGRTHQALVHLRSICERAATADDLEMLLFGLSSASDMAADAGDAAWLDELDAALETVGDSADVYVEALGASLADALARSRALRSAGRARFDEALRHIDALGPAAAPRRRARAGEAALYAAAAGDAARARDERLRGRRLLEGDGDDGSPDALFTRLFLALAAILGDEPAECDEHLALLEARADRIALPHISFVRAARAAAEYAANRTARSRLTDATSALSRSGLGGFAALIDGLPIRPAVVVPSSALTATEVRVLELLCDGLTSREIAARLERSVLTIDSHAKTIVRKLRCTGGRREAVEMARSGRIAGFAARQGKVAG